MTDYDELSARIGKWVDAIMGPNGLDFVDESAIMASDFIVDRVSMLTLLACRMNINDAMRTLFTMGMAWQKYLDSEASGDLNNLLRDVNLE